MKLRKMKGSNNLSLESLQEELGHTEDLKIKKIESNNDSPFIIVYISSMIDEDKLEWKVIKPLTNMKKDDFPQGLFTEQVESVSNAKEAIDQIIQGYALVLKDEEAKEGYLVNVIASSGRDVADLVNEKSMFGSHEAFVEDLNENITLIRKRIASPGVTVDNYEVGTKAKTNVSIIYLKDRADPKVVKKIQERIESIDIDFIRSAGDIEHLVEEDTFSPFPQLLITEDPERASANIKDEKIVMLVEGSANVYILPATFTLFFQAPDDYMSRWQLGTIYRLIRFTGYLAALLLPALYIALVSFHYEVIPAELIYSFQLSLSYVPFQPILELIFMQVAFEFLREASLRLPPPIAATFGIVGAIVVGTATVEAGFVSYGGLVIVSLTAVGSFVQPNIEMSNSIRFLGFPLMILASMFGFLGIIFGYLLIIIHVTRLTSFGSPYFVPFAPLRVKDFKDSVFRIPLLLRKQGEVKPSKRKIVGWKMHERKRPY